MPRSSVAATEVAEFALNGEPLPPPAELTAAQRADWQALVDAYPGRFGPSDVPLLVELVRHQSVARKLARELATMERRSLASSSKDGAANRAVYLQLLGAANAESRIVASLAVKLRLARTTAVRKITHEREQRAVPAGPRPWDDNVERRN
jgi:hypothetical protein